MTKVIALNGGPTGLPEINQAAVSALEEWLEAARSGQIVGLVMVGLGHDAKAQWEIAGMVGGYGMIGALDIAKSDLVDLARGNE